MARATCHVLIVQVLRYVQGKGRGHVHVAKATHVSPPPKGPGLCCFQQPATVVMRFFSPFFLFPPLQMFIDFGELI